MKNFKIILFLIIFVFTFSLTSGIYATEVADDGEANIMAKPLKQKFREFSVFLNLSSKNLNEQEFKTKLNDFFKTELEEKKNDSIEEINREGDDSVIIESVNITKKILVEVKSGVDKKIIPLLITNCKKNSIKFNFKKYNNHSRNSIDFIFTGSKQNMRNLGKSLLTLKSNPLYKLGILLSN